MSATIRWQAVKASTLNTGNSAASSIIEALTRAFGEFPIELTEQDMDVLRGMAATCQVSNDNPYQALMNAISEHGTIEVKASY